MKNVCLALFAALTTLGMMGCDKDESSSNVIVGEWRMTDTYTNDGMAIHTVLGQPEVQTFSYHGTEYNATTTFTENPNEFISAGYYKYEFTSTFLGSTETLLLQSDAIPGTGQWSMEGDTLFQTFAGVTKAYVILDLDESNMDLRLDLNTTEGGVPTTATIYSSFVKN